MSFMSDPTVSTAYKLLPMDYSVKSASRDYKWQTLQACLELRTADVLGVLIGVEAASDFIRSHDLYETNTHKWVCPSYLKIIFGPASQIFNQIRCSSLYDLQLKQHLQLYMCQLVVLNQNS